MRRNDLWLAAAESCTGGLLSSLITDQPGSSAIFLGGLVSYANDYKQQFLDVKESTLIAYGAVSEQTAAEMAHGIRLLSQNASIPLDKIVGLSITGIAGPGGGTPQKPVGLVWLGVESAAGALTRRYQHDSGRLQNKKNFSQQALDLLYEHLLAGYS